MAFTRSIWYMLYALLIFECTVDVRVPANTHTNRHSYHEQNEKKVYQCANEIIQLQFSLSTDSYAGLGCICTLSEWTVS